MTLKGNRFATIEEIKSNQEQMAIPKIAFQKCIISAGGGGVYFEEDKIVIDK